MIERYIEPFSSKLILRPVSLVAVKFVSNNPNFYTLLAAVLGVFGVVLVYFGYIWQAVLLFIGSGLCDMLDGYIARFIDKCSNIGSVIDIVSDRFVEFSIVFSIYLINPLQNSVYCILMLGSILLCVTSFLVVGIFTENSTNKSFYYSPGLIERAEAFVFFILMLCLNDYTPLISTIFIALVLLTVIIRVYQFIEGTIARD
ncbi:MAG: CDP-alcohol phosphatidyltransferase family protein [Legionellales bacterium]|nr:CDP-alcohol phosphatidyltransferase family protein [Legionellales bacterium]